MKGAQAYKGRRAAKSNARAQMYQVTTNWDEKSAQAWAVRKGFTEKELDDFDVFLDVLDSCFIKPTAVTVRVSTTFMRHSALHPFL